MELSKIEKDSSLSEEQRVQKKEELIRDMEQRHNAFIASINS